MYAEESIYDNGWQKTVFGEPEGFPVPHVRKAPKRLRAEWDHTHDPDYSEAYREWYEYYTEWCRGPEGLAYQRAVELWREERAARDAENLRLAMEEEENPPPPPPYEEWQKDSYLRYLRVIEDISEPMSQAEYWQNKIDRACDGARRFVASAITEEQLHEVASQYRSARLLLQIKDRRALEQHETLYGFRFLEEFPRHVDISMARAQTIVDLCSSDGRPLHREWEKDLELSPQNLKLPPQNLKEITCQRDWDRVPGIPADLKEAKIRNCRIQVSDLSCHAINATIFENCSIEGDARWIQVISATFINCTFMGGSFRDWNHVRTTFDHCRFLGPYYQTMDHSRIKKLIGCTLTDERATNSDGERIGSRL